MGEVTPLLIDFWIWLVLIGFWLITALFVHKTKTREKWFGRMQHAVPLYVGFYLIFAKRQFGPMDYRLYENNAIAWLGVPLTLAGVFFAIWARATIGRWWSGFVTLKEGHKLIRTGPYKITRHPIYTGFSVAAFGSALSAARVDALIGVAIITISFLFKLRREETLLTGEFGDEYVRFKREVPALFPLGWLSPGANEPIQSDAFQKAVLRSDKYRIIGMLCVCGAFAIMDVVMALASPDQTRRYLIYITWWGILAAYETAFLILANASQRRGRSIRPWIWAINTALECLLPSIAIMGLTMDKSYLGPYRALVSSSVGIYFFFIILSTLRLSPLLCIIAGTVCSAGYTAVYAITLWGAPNNDYRHFMPDRIYILYSIMLVGAGLLAAAVAQRIRQHVIAALTEAETRRLLDRIEYDLNIARSIQIGLLPKLPPKVDGYDIAGWSQPAQQTGGDYYDWLEQPGSKLMFTIADATGHGIGPALLAAACRASFRAVAMHDDPLDRIIQKVDALISTDAPDGRFITAAIALLDPMEHRISLYSAGHAPLYLYTAATHEVTSFDADQPPLGTSFDHNGSTSKARVISLSPGDALVLVTDGFFECFDRAGQMLGAARMADFIRAGQSTSAQQFIARMHKHVLDFSQGLPQADDLTAIVIKRRVLPSDSAH